jgi:elongation factor Ts
MAFSAKDVKDLREKTGCGMMDCKKALTESDGDLAKAVDLLREKGLAAAAKKSGRIAAEGMAFAIKNSSEDVGAIIEINSETDFVAKNAGFQEFVKTCAQTVIETNPKDLAELLATKAFSQAETVEELLREKILTIGENIKIRRFARLEGVLATYIHADGKIAVIVKFDAPPEVAQKEGFRAFAKDVAMQVAAAAPGYLTSDEVPAEVIEHEKKILTEQIVNDGKPANIAQKIVEGRIGKFFKENCLMDQAFVKDQAISVSQYAQNISKELGAQISVGRFVRFEKGEGLEKKEDNFAEEVAGMLG